MKNFLLKFLMMLTVFALGATSCAKDPKEDGGRVDIHVDEINFDRVVFTLTPSNFTPTVYAYKVVPRGTALTAAQIFDTGIKGLDHPFVATGLVKNTDYTLWAIGVGGGGLSAASSVDFTTVENSLAPPTAKSIGIILNAVGYNTLNFGLNPGTEVTGGMVYVIAKAAFENFFYELKKENPEATVASVARDLLYYQEYGVTVEGDELEILWEEVAGAKRLFPNTRYMVLTLGMVGETPGDGAVFEFRTSSYGIVNAPSVETTVDVLSFMGVVFRYKIAKGTYGFARFVGDTNQIDEFLQHFTEEDLADFVRDFDAIYPMTGQIYTEMESASDGTAVKVQTNNFGFDSAGAKITSVAVAVDENGMHSKKISRSDVVLSAKPDSAPAEFTVSAWGSATCIVPHFEFGANCFMTYYNMVPKALYESTISGKGGEAGYAYFLWNEGYAMVREAPRTPNEPIFQNDWIWSGFTPNTEYVIVATAQNYDMLLNQKLTVSAPFKTKSLEAGTSPCKIELKVTKTAKTQASISVGNPTGDLVCLYLLCIADNNPEKPATDEAIYNGLYREQFDQWWGWYKNMDPDWDPTTKTTSGSFTALKVGTAYTIYYCGEDKNGKITPLGKCQFETTAPTLGPNPKVVSMSAYEITAMTCMVDIVINDQVGEGQMLFIQESLLNYDPATDTEAELRAAVYDAVMAQGMPFEESVSGQLMDAGLGGKNAVFYLGAVVSGSAGATDFKYMKVELGDGKGNVSGMPSQNFKNIQAIPLHSACVMPIGQKAALEANRKLRPEGNVINYRTQEELNIIFDKMGVSKPHSMSDLYGAKRKKN